MNGDTASHFVRVLKDDTGERIPFLIDRTTGLPVLEANQWRLLRRRGACQSSTLKKELLEVSYLYRWARERGIDLVTRMNTGKGILLRESTDLIEYLKQDFTQRKHQGLLPAVHVSPAVQQQRFSTIRTFLQWWMDTVLERVEQTDSAGDAKYIRVMDQRERMLRWLTSPSGSAGQREGLTPAQRKLFQEVIHPEHPRNPWSRETRLRNFVAFSIYFWLGLRLSELLLVKCHHIDVMARSPTLLVERHPDDVDDARSDRPEVKTLGRLLPVPAVVVPYLKRYIRNERGKVGTSKAHPFLLVAYPSGSPLSKRAVQHALAQLVSRFPEFRSVLTVHVLRHCWSDMMHRHLSDMVRQGRLDSEFAKLLFNYLGGWSHASTQHAKYSHAEIRRAADEALLGIHHEMFSGAE